MENPVHMHLFAHKKRDPSPITPIADNHFAHLFPRKKGPCTRAGSLCGNDCNMNQALQLLLVLVGDIRLMFKSELSS